MPGTCWIDVRGAGIGGRERRADEKRDGDHLQRHTDEARAECELTDPSRTVLRVGEALAQGTDEAQDAERADHEEKKATMS